MAKPHTLKAQIGCVDRAITSYRGLANKRGDPFQSRHAYELSLMEAARDTLALVQANERLFREAIEAKRAAKAGGGGSSERSPADRLGRTPGAAPVSAAALEPASAASGLTR